MKREKDCPYCYPQMMAMSPEGLQALREKHEREHCDHCDKCGQVLNES